MSNLQKRFFIAVPLGIVFGFLCAWFASSSNPGLWWTPLMWTLVTDRFLIGLIIGLAGVYTKHPLFGFRFPAVLRGFVLGAMVSLPIASGGMMSPNPEMGPWAIFWASILAGAVYGLIIDLVATKFAGEGKELLK